MKKIFALIFGFVYCTLIYAQQTVNTTISGSMTALCYNNTNNSYTTGGNDRIGQCQSDGTSTANGNLHNYVLVIFDLGQQLGGKVSAIDNNSNVTLQLDGGHGYTGANWQAGFITNDVSNSGAQTQINAIQNMTYSYASDVPTSQPPTITMPITYQRIVANKIIVGVRRDNAGLQYLASCTATINGTVLRLATLNVTYNQGSGNIVAYVGSTYQAPAAPAHPSGYETDQVHIAPLSPTITNYQMVYNETQAPSNKSYWQKTDNNNNPSGQLYPASSSFSLLKSEDHWTYEAQMRKLCTATFVKPDGNTSQSIVEGNASSSVTAPDYYVSSDWISLSFVNWTWSGGSNSSNTITPTVNAHTKYTANYTGVANPSPMNICITSTIGEPIKLSWTDHPSPGVTGYQVWRWIKYYQNPQPVGGVLSKGTTSFTDAYVQSYTGKSLFYTVKAYYAPSNTWNDPGYLAVTGNLDLNMASNNNNALLLQSGKEVPTEYSISNFPNPFNPTTVINYQLAKDGFVSLKVYDILGKEVATLVNENKQAGYYNATFNATNLPSGIYIYSIKANGFNQSKKMILTK